MSTPSHENYADHDDPEPGSTWFIGLAGAIVFTALVLAISVLYYGITAEREQEVVISQSSTELEMLRLGQLEETREYGRYTVKDADLKEIPKIRIPVSDAMQLVLKDGKLGREAAGAASSPPKAP